MANSALILARITSPTPSIDDVPTAGRCGSFGHVRPALRIEKFINRRLIARPIGICHFNPILHFEIWRGQHNSRIAGKRSYHS
jgi:hypothetical protein